VWQGIEYAIIKEAQTRLGCSRNAGCSRHARKRGGTTPVRPTDREVMHEFIQDRVDSSATIYTDEYRSYVGVLEKHQTVKHNDKEFVYDMAYTNSIESVWT